MDNNKMKVFTVQLISKVRAKHFLKREIMKKERLHGLNRPRAHIMRMRRKNHDIKKRKELEEDNDSRCINGLFGPLALIICIVSTFGIMLFPTHNILINPECWYEIIFSTSLFYLFASSVVAIETEATITATHLLE